jgi:nitrile hydratase
LVEKGFVEPAAIDAIIETYEVKIGPRNGACVVARAWVDAPFKRRLLGDASAAIAEEFAFGGRQGEHIIAVENTPARRCSCYPWPLLGVPPVWYKSALYRSRAVIDPRGVLAEFGVQLPETTEIVVHDSTAETRYLVRPEGTKGWDEEHLADLITRDDDRHGPRLPTDGSDVNGAQDLGGMMGFGSVNPERNEPVFHADWEKRALGLTVAVPFCDRRPNANKGDEPGDPYPIAALRPRQIRHSVVCGVISCFPTRMRTRAVKIRNDVMRFGLMAVNFGDRRPIPLSSSVSIYLSPIWCRCERINCAAPCRCFHDSP